MANTDELFVIVTGTTLTAAVTYTTARVHAAAPVSKISDSDVIVTVESVYKPLGVSRAITDTMAVDVDEDNEMMHERIVKLNIVVVKISVVVSETSVKNLLLLQTKVLSIRSICSGTNGAGGNANVSLIVAIRSLVKMSTKDVVATTESMLRILTS